MEAVRKQAGSLNLELKELMTIIQLWIDTRKVGHVTINFFKGGISSIRVEETLKLKTTQNNGG